MNEKYIWDYLIKRINNPYGVAAIMGNLMAESSLNPAKANTSNKNYVKDVKNGTIDFIHDRVAFGLVQWCYWSRKEKFYNYVKENYGIGNIDNLYTQLEYMLYEMKNHYKTAYNAVINATDIRTASDVVMIKYEKPAGTDEKYKKRRADYGQKYYDMFAGSEPTPEPSPTPDPTPSGKKVVVATSKVNIRAGNSKSYDKIGSLPLGKELEYLKTENGWHAVVCWISGEFSAVEER